MRFNVVEYFDVTAQCEMCENIFYCLFIHADNCFGRYQRVY